jgi:hypothetical protein
MVSDLWEFYHVLVYACICMSVPLPQWDSANLQQLVNKVEFGIYFSLMLGYMYNYARTSF